jgi:hypothetical protein
MVSKELIQVVRDSLNDGDITAPDELVAAIAELWDINSRLARIIENQTKAFVNKAYYQGYNKGYEDGGDGVVG